MNHPIPDLHHSIELPIIKSIICQLSDEGVIPKYDKYTYQPIMEKVNTEGGKYPYIFKETNLMEVRGDIVLADGLNVANALNPHRSGILPIFLDESVHCALQPVHNKMYVELDIIYHTTSMEILHLWRQKVHEFAMLGADRWTHEVQYGFRIPGECMELLEDVHAAIEKKAGYGDDFPTYLHKHLIKGAKLVSSGGYQQINIQYMQTKVIGYLEPTIEISKSDDTGYVGTGKYKVWFDMPRSIISLYDVQVHQTLLPKKYLPIDFDQKKHYGILTNQDRSLLEPVKPSDRYGIIYKEIDLTPFDPSIISAPPKAYRVVWQALLTLDTGKVGEVLCNLMELPRLCMPEWMFCIINNFKDRVVLPYRSPLLFSLHRGRDLMDMVYLELDDNLNIVTKRDLDLRDNWHLTLSCSMNPSYIIQSSMDDLCETCENIKEPLTELVLALNTGNVRRRINVMQVVEEGICTPPSFNIYTVQDSVTNIFHWDEIKDRPSLIRS